MNVADAGTLVHVENINSADSFAAFISQWLATAVSVHQGHMPEIGIIDDSTATGVWAMYDWLDDPDHGRALQGYGLEAGCRAVPAQGAAADNHFLARAVGGRRVCPGGARL